TLSAGPTINCQLCFRAVHVCCSNIPKTVAKFIGNEDLPGLKWFCPGCRGVADSLLERNRLITDVLRRYDDLELVVRGLAVEVRSGFAHFNQTLEKLSNPVASTDSHVLTNGQRHCDDAVMTSQLQSEGPVLAES